MRHYLLRLLRVPPDPAPPAGAPGSLRVFRAGRRLYHLRLLHWGLGQTGAAVGIIFSFGMIDRFEAGIRPSPAAASAPVVASSGPAPAEPPTPATAPATSSGEAPTPAKTAKSRARSDRGRTALKRVTDRSPTWLFPLLRLAELGAVVLFVVQFPITCALVRLDYELRWYLVTDRSLRIRTGLTRVQESTMSFANLQQVAVTQGPVQRLLGLADVRVQSAGGGGGAKPGSDHADSLHTGVFHGVENAHEIRDLILERLRRYRETGLGDPDEPRPAPSAPLPPADHPPEGMALAAARELLDEVRALRRQPG